MRTLLPDPEAAEDVLQEACITTWQKFDSYDRQRPFLPWACKIALHKVLDHYKAKRVRARYFSQATVELLAKDQAARSAEENDLAEERLRYLGSCLEKLASADRELLSQRYAGKETLVHIASRTERPVKELYNSLERIRRRLLKCIEKSRMSPGGASP